MLHSLARSLPAKVGSALDGTVALILPVDGYVDLKLIGRDVLLHLARESQPAAGEQAAMSIAESRLLRLASIDRDKPPSRPRDAKKQLQRRDERLFRIGAAALSRILAERCGHTQEQAAANIEALCGIEITPDQLGRWHRLLVREEAELGVSLPGGFDQGRAHRLHDARVKLDAVADEIPRAAKLSPTRRWRLRARLAEAEATYQRVRNDVFPEFDGPHGERTPDEHDRTANLAEAAADAEHAHSVAVRQVAPVTTYRRPPEQVGGKIELRTSPQPLHRFSAITQGRNSVR
jgi:hypothetical protein